MARKQILVIAPHADDEVLGCGGYLLHQKELGADIFILVGTIGCDMTTMTLNPQNRQDFNVRMAEFGSVSEILGADCDYIVQNMDAMLDAVPSREIISKIDNVIDIFKPDEVFINYRSHHQDHIKMYECAMASLRPREGFSPKFVALYEYPFILSSQSDIKGGAVYHDITDNIEKKIKLFDLYSTQIRQYPSPLNETGIKKLAEIRGLENGTQYAEKFYVQKMTI